MEITLKSKFKVGDFVTLSGSLDIFCVKKLIYEENTFKYVLENILKTDNRFYSFDIIDDDFAREKHLKKFDKLNYKYFKRESEELISNLNKALKILKERFES